MPFGYFSAIGARVRLLVIRALGRLGLSESAFLVVAAVLIGVITSCAAVAFHELIVWVRHWLYERSHPRIDLYGRGIIILIGLPMLGGLLVGLIGRYLIRIREGGGIVDVLESVLRSRGVINPALSVEKILTSGITIGSGGSAGAEGPIVQIGASIASTVGRFFRVARLAMPVLIGCGSAAGISAIFNSPLGGVLFTLEVILQDFSLRTFTPVVMASVVANVTTQAIYQRVLHQPEYNAIFFIPNWIREQHLGLDWGQVGNFILLGLVCGGVAVTFTRMMYRSEALFWKLKFPKVLKPALGGALLGTLGVGYVMVFGWMRGVPKPFEVSTYAMPAFFGDGYGVIRKLLDAEFYAQLAIGPVLVLVASLIVLKLVGTCLTLGSGGSGGIIAPSLFLGAASGACVGILLRQTGLFPFLQPEVYALVGMGAVLGAVVHAPLTGILILFDVTRDEKVMLPALLTTMTATAFARLLFKDSIYTLALRKRGVYVGGGTMGILQRTTVEQVELEPATVVGLKDPLTEVIELVTQHGVGDVVVMQDQRYIGMITARDIQMALWQREALPLLSVSDLVRTDLPPVLSSDDLAVVLDRLSRAEVTRLPVCLDGGQGQVIGMISRAALLRKYQKGE